jgi:hypothetical protein
MPSVADVHDVANVVPALAEEAIEKINGDECAEIPYVPVVIHGRPAGIHADAIALERVKFFDLPGESVIEMKSHG